MFGSISNWITTTSSNITSNIPPVNLPNIPDIFTKSNTKSDQEILNSEKNIEEQNNLKTENTLDKNDSSNPLISSNLEEKANQKEAENKHISVENADSARETEEKFGVISQLDIDAQKAYGQAKEIGSNIGSKKMFL